MFTLNRAHHAATKMAFIDETCRRRTPCPYEYTGIDMKHERLFAQFCVHHPPQRQTIDGIVWEYIAAGQGEACLLLLPGAMGVADTSFHYLLAFVGSYRVLSVSYPPAQRLIIAAQDHGSARKAVGDHIAAYRTFLQEVAA